LSFFFFNNKTKKINKFLFSKQKKFRKFEVLLLGDKEIEVSFWGTQELLKRADLTKIFLLQDSKSENQVLYF